MEIIKVRGIIMEISKNLEKNIENIKQSYGNSDDLVTRNINIKRKKNKEIANNT